MEERGYEGMGMGRGFLVIRKQLWCNADVGSLWVDCYIVYVSKIVSQPESNLCKAFTALCIIYSMPEVAILNAWQYLHPILDPAMDDGISVNYYPFIPLQRMSILLVSSLFKYLQTS